MAVLKFRALHDLALAYTCRLIRVAMSTYRLVVGCGRLPFAGLTFTLPGCETWVTGHLLSPSRGYKKPSGRHHQLSVASGFSSDAQELPL
jgi:hypothetical protein